MKINLASIIAILCITILLVVALVLGFDGVALAGGIAVIAGLGGWSAHQKQSQHKKP